MINTEQSLNLVLIIFNTDDRGIFIGSLDEKQLIWLIKAKVNKSANKAVSPGIGHDS